MRPIRVYADTSVFGGVFDAEFADASAGFFDAVREGAYIVLLSEATVRELALAPARVRDLWQSLPASALEEVSITPEVQELADAYLAAGVLGPASVADALHVAAATVAGADVILSWNFAHIVNFNRIRRFNGINVTNGYRAMTILSPLEVGTDERENEDI